MAVVLPKICHVIVLWAEEAVENDKAYAATCRRQTRNNNRLYSMV